MAGRDTATGEKFTWMSMSNLLSIWNTLSVQRRALLVGVLVVTISAFALLMQTAAKPKMAFLYGGLDPAAAGDILSALESMDVSADVRGDAIYVPESRRDSVRMTLARQGLPQQGQPGFELLDEMNGFATTSEMFDAAYWRAKEGELARTILATPGVRSARVHLAAPSTSAFQRARRTPSASVTVGMARGRLGLQHATSIRYLVALAVPDLVPEQVAIMDAVHGLILKPGADDDFVSSGDEPDRIRRLESSLMDLIEARVGPGNARVTVSLKIDREREQVSERILDPESRVMMNRETKDIQESDIGGGGAVTVASNLPEGDVNGNTSTSRAQRNETTEMSRFEISEVHRQREKFPGAVARINVAVLVNGAEDTNSDTVLRSPEELDSIRSLVAAAIGFDDARGDIITVKAMPFHQPTVTLDDAETSSIRTFLKENLISILQVVVPALVVLALAFFVIRPVLTQNQPAPVAVSPSVETAILAANDSQETSAPKSPVDALRDIAAERPSDSTKILKSWLGDTEEAA
ncbi:MAG: flagellar basal-body MS-ring/collar protein FliF [Pseudomonadota bacterium]